MKDRKGIGGRPRERADAVKATPISIRTVPALKAEIERRALLNGLSVTQQVEQLLRLGWEHDKAA